MKRVVSKRKGRFQNEKGGFKTKREVSKLAGRFQNTVGFGNFEGRFQNTN